MYRISAVTLALALLTVPAVGLAAELGSEVVADGERVTAALNREFTLTHGSRRFVASPQTVQSWVRIRHDGDTTFLKLRPDAIYAFLNQQVSPAVNDTGENARFIFRNGVAELKAPGRSGKIVDGVATSLALRDALAAGGSTGAVARKAYAPPVLTLEDFRTLGIRERIGRGESDFRGSPANRRKNISVGRLKFQGILVPPGQEFSFNRYLGSVTAAAGYLPELVIKENVTTPEFGGGLCQVSTTAFRAAVNAGLDVTARRQHAYPVKYYGIPGFDATIYPPNPDLRFRNTTGNWLLIQTAQEGTKLIFEVYGKNDGRTVKVDGPHVTERRPDGSVRALLGQTVRDKNGAVIHTEVFKSTYKSPELFPTVRKQNGEAP